jgi:hypothetical protein
MSLLKQINDKGAVIEWSPISQYANMVALGTKVHMCCFLGVQKIIRIFRIQQDLDLMTMGGN